MPEYTAKVPFGHKDRFSATYPGGYQVTIEADYTRSPPQQTHIYEEAGREAARTTYEYSERHARAYEGARRAIAEGVPIIPEVLEELRAKIWVEVSREGALSDAFKHELKRREEAVAALKNA